MNAQEMSFYPKGENEEAVSPILIPYALKVVRGALNNPSCNQDVTEISSHTLDVFANNNFTEEWKPKIQAQLEEAYGDLNRSNNSNTRQNRQDFDVNTARIECATKYMGARGMDFVRDANGNHLLVPRNNGTGDLQSRINAELERQNNSVSEKQKPQLQIHTPKKSQVRKY